MGMYTEIFVSVPLIEDLHPGTLDILRHLFDHKAEVPKPDFLPDHEYFYAPRWDAIGSCSSYYFVPGSTSRMWKDKYNNQWYITSRSDLKNYSNEITLFFKWLDPLVDLCPGEMMGYSRYEEDNLPSLFLKGGSIIQVGGLL